MAYSSIVKKKCKGENCNKYPVLGMAGYCYSCSPEEIKLKVGNKRKAAQKRKNERLSIARKAMVLPANVEMIEKAKKKLNQEDWYIKQRVRMCGYCCNCGKSSPKNNDKYFKWGILHVFPKSLFPSVAMNDDNWIEGCLECHTLFDRNLDTASKMPMFKLAVDQYEKFKDEITETHKYHDLFLEYENQLK